MIKNDKWIKQMAAQKSLIMPFEEKLINKSEETYVLSYGLSSYGYDIRLSDKEFWTFRHIPGSVVDPKNFNPKNLEKTDLLTDLNGSKYFILPAHSYGLGVAVEKLNIPENISCLAIGKSTYARCFRGDTRVALVDGTSPTLEEMAKRSEQGENFWGYSIGQHGRIIVTLLENPRYIGRDSLLEVTLDNQESIFCTPDHLFMTRDGRMIEAHKLRPQDSLMPLYRQLARGYEVIYQPLNGHLYPTHRLSDEWNLYQGIYNEVPNTHRHHIDFNRLNNNPWNIMRMDASAHIKLHNTKNYGEEFDPDEHGESIKEAIVKLKQNPEWNAMFSQQQKNKALDFWHKPEYREIREKVLNNRKNCSDSTRELHRQSMLKYYQNPQARIITAEFSKQAWAKDDGTRRLKQSELMKRLSDVGRTRHDINAEILRLALDESGSIRGAAKLLNCDRSVFRRFPEVIKAFRGLPVFGVGKNHKVISIKEISGVHDVYCLTVPDAGNFALEAGVFVHNCGIIANTTPAEPGWIGHLTLEFSNSSGADCRIYANEGIVQLLFFEGEPCEVTYAQRTGKYQNQTEEVTIAKV